MYHIATLMSIFNNKKKMAKALLSSLDNTQHSKINWGKKKDLDMGNNAIQVELWQFTKGKSATDIKIYIRQFY